MIALHQRTPRSSWVCLLAMSISKLDRATYQADDSIVNEVMRSDFRDVGREVPIKLGPEQ